MMAAKQIHPIEVLRQLENRSRENAKGLPQQTEQENLWSGIGFRIGETCFISPATQIHEIQRYPRLTMVPGTHRWVRGLANFRGTLLTIVDMQSYFNQPPIQILPHSRILVIQQAGLTVGLLVTEVVGLKNFSPDDRGARDEQLDSAIKNHVRGTFQKDGITWHLFDMKSLTADPYFYQVAT